MNKMPDQLKSLERPDSRRTIDIVNRGLKRRYRAERRFKIYGVVAIALSLAFLALLFVTIIGKGYSAFQQTEIKLDIYFDPAEFETELVADANFPALVKSSLRGLFPDVSGRGEKRSLYGLVSPGAAFQVRSTLLEDRNLIGQAKSIWLLANDDVDMLVKGHMDRALPENDRRLKDSQLAWIDQLNADGRLRKAFNVNFFQRRLPRAGAVRYPGSADGQLLHPGVTLLLSFPIGVAAAVYLEEFAPKNRWTDIIEVNINNLAAVPSIVFGLLGLAVFLNFFGLPRSAPLVGGLVLTLMTLPTIIIASRARPEIGAAVDPRGGAGRRCLQKCRWCFIMSCRWPCRAC
jgi:phosphate transport system permease protein